MLATIQDSPAEAISDVRGPEEFSSLDELYRLHSKSLFRYLLRLSYFDEREAEDLLQETFLRAWRFVRTGEVDVQQLRPWLFTVAKRIAIDAARSKRVRPVAAGESDLAAIASPQDDVERLVTSLSLRQALAQLSPKHQRVLIEIYIHGRTFQETAQLLDIPLGTVRSRSFYGLRALASAIGTAAEYG